MGYPWGFRLDTTVLLGSRDKPANDDEKVSYFLDFVCLDRRLVIELDGGHHNDPAQAEHDRIRDAVLQRAGFNVLRFANSSVRTDINAVMDAIILALEAAPSVLSKGEPTDDTA